jgi:hypothetical protein
MPPESLARIYNTPKGACMQHAHRNREFVAQGNMQAQTKNLKKSLLHSEERLALFQVDGRKGDTTFMNKAEVKTQQGNCVMEG